MSRFIFRVDGNSTIGLGHIMRCLSIADECRRMGHIAIFVLADQEVADLVLGRGYKVCALGTDFRDMEGELPNWRELAGEFCKEMSYEGEILVLDSYFVTERYLNELKSILCQGVVGRKLVYIDDLAEFPYPVDALVNYNAYAEEKDYEMLYARGNCGFESPELILGVSYAPLREMFREVRFRNQKCAVRDVLISTGGADPKHLALAMVEEIRRLGEKGALGEIVFHILVGAANLDSDRLYEIVDGVPEMTIHQNVSDMSELICACDVAVSAAGSTMYEICACGVPMVTYVFADNQIRGAKALAEIGLAEDCGDVRGLMNSEPCKVAEMLLDKVRILGKDYDKRVEMGRRMQSLVDGRGAERCVKRMEKLLLR